MAKLRLELRWKVGGVLADATAVRLSDPTGTFGVRRTDTLATVVADATAMTRVSTGVYVHEFDEPATGLSYNWWAEVEHAGLTHHFEKQTSGTTAGTLETYVTLSDANVLAGELPGLASWAAANDADKVKALKQATKDIDSGLRYQGRRYELDPSLQRLEFPRIPYPQTSGYDLLSGEVVQVGDEVWDWDEDNDVAVVPEDVKVACLQQADSILKGKRAKRLAAQHDGVASQGVGSLSESYTGRAPQKLCFEAYELLKKYELRSGQLL